MEHRHHHRRKLASTNLHQYNGYAVDDEQDEDYDVLLPNPVGWAVGAISAAFSTNSATVVLLRKLGFGALAAAHVCLVLAAAAGVAAAVGAGAVRMLAEEPVSVEEPLHFDCTEARPSATLVLGGINGRKMGGGVPVGHTFFVSLLLVLPESDFNLHLGVFQVTAEFMSATGDIMATSGQPCMLRFRSSPVRLMQTFIMGLPIVMGIFGETQEIRVKILKHKEGYPRTEAIKVTLKPRAGSTALPELYAARIIINSQLPWRKELVYNWKWTFYVWSSLCTYIMLLMILFSCCKPIVFPLMSVGDRKQRDQTIQVVRDQQSNLGGDGAISDDECSDTLRKWRQIRSERKSVMIRTGAILDSDPVSSCASSVN